VTEATNAIYEFRWDVEVPEEGRNFGPRFMKQWRKVLQAQKMTALISNAVAPQQARFQLCVAGETGGDAVSEREKEIKRELARLRWCERSPDESIQGEPAGSHPAGWQGVRVWVAFAKSDVESALGKKPKF
jgi:hypothetical protein